MSLLNTAYEVVLNILFQRLQPYAENLARIISAVSGKENLLQIFAYYEMNIKKDNSMWG
jgi:hypothetical protein